MIETITIPAATTAEAPKAAAKKPAKPAKRKSKKPAKPAFKPTLPQARVLRALQGGDPMPRAKVAKLAGFSPISGTMPRCLNGSKKLGVAALVPNYVKWVEGLIDGMASEWFLQITQAGKKVLKGALVDMPRLPKLRDHDASVNHRYQPSANGKTKAKRKASKKPAA